MHRPGEDDLDIVEVREPDQSVVDAEPAPPSGPRRRVALLAVLAVVAVCLGAVAWVAVHRAGTDRRADPPAGTSAQQSRPAGSVACGGYRDCIVQQTRTPTSGVSAALRTAFPTIDSTSAQRLIDPGTGIVRSQFVVAQVDPDRRITVSVSYDGDEFVVSETSHEDDGVHYFDRHTFEGWSIEVTLSGPAAAGYQAEGLRLLRDNRLLS